VKPPDDASDAAAGGSGDAPGPDVEGESDDPKLRAMRAVWLTMREEAPPDRGLAELLSAARAKAASMAARPTMWQRLLAAMRRPQMLAVATVLVLISGAVLVGRRALVRPAAHAVDAGGSPGASTELRSGGSNARADTGAPALANDKKEQRAPSGEVDHDAQVMPVRTPQAGRMVGAGGAQDAPAGPGAGHAKTDAAVAGADHAAKAGHAERPSVPTDGLTRGRAAEAPRRPDPAPEPATETAAEAEPATADPAAGPARPRRRGGTLSASGSGAGSGTRRQTDDRASGAAGAADRERADRRPGPPPAAPAPPPVEVPAEAADEPPTADQLARLYRQCEAAARRGDCAEVRRKLGRIMQADRSYRARAARDAAMAKCLTAE
jgi:hypothetical protein